MKDVQYGNTHYDELNVVGQNMLIEKLDESQFRKSGGIYLPTIMQNKQNMKIGVGKILQVGGAVTEKYGVKAGEYILYDYYSATHDIGNTVIVKAENIILVVDQQQAKEFLSN